MSRRRTKPRYSFRLWWQLLTGAALFLSIVVAVFNRERIIEIMSRAEAEPANIIVDTQAVLGPLGRPWRNLAQGGESHGWRLQPLVPQVRQLNPEYIRIDHIYDFYDVVQGSSGALQFDFSKLDALLDDILATGAKPYISLSYMPPAISSGDIVAPPTSYSDWQVTVQRTIEHISGTRGIANVYYEVWNEPDLFGNWKYYGGRNYLDLYAAAARGAAQARGVQPFKIGGPATTALYKNWFDALAAYVIENNLRLDFISWHRYDTDLNRYKQDMFEVQTWIEAYPQLRPTVEFHITEWGHDSEIHPGYDTAYSAAHTVAGSIEMVGIIDRAFIFEIQDGKDPGGQALWGRWGMFTHGDFGAQAKPRYHAIKLLESLGGERVQLLGKGTYVKALAAKSDEHTFQVLLSNFDPAGRNIEAVPVRFDRLEPGIYTVTKSYLTKAAEKQEMSTSETSLLLTVPMGSSEVALITIKKQ